MSRSSAVRRVLHYSWAVILVHLCTGEPVDGRSVVILSGMLSEVPHSLLLRHKLMIFVVLFTFEISIFKSVSDERLCLKVLIEL